MTWAKHHPEARFDLQGSNLLPCDLSDLPGALEALRVNGANDLGYRPLVEAISARYGVEPERVAQGPGASGANFLALAALVRPGDHVVVEWPGYDPHGGTARFLGCTVGTFQRHYSEGFRLDPDRVEAALTDRTRAIVLSNPHNPSGALAGADELQALGRVADRVGATVVVDEVYLDTVYSESAGSAATLDGPFAITNSLTKSYGLSWLRAGWLIAAPEVVERCWRIRDILDAVGSFPSDVLTLVAFQHLDRLRERARSILVPNLRGMAGFVESRAELEWVPPSGGSVGFPRMVGEADTNGFVEHARERFGVGVVPGRFFGAPAHIRISASGSPEALRSGLEALGKALDAWN
jgi:aspartate/methionine/tyrosine aminotransferase